MFLNVMIIIFSNSNTQVFYRSFNWDITYSLIHCHELQLIHICLYLSANQKH